MIVLGIIGGLIFVGICLLIPHLWKLKYIIAAMERPVGSLVEEKPEDVDSVFMTFVGNKPTVETLKKLIKYSKLNRDYTIPAIGLFGAKSTGKTELARRIAKALEYPLVPLNKSCLESEAEFIKRIDVYESSVVLVDEAHLLPRKLQDSLLTALEPNDRTIITKQGVYSTRNIVFVIATTEPDKLSSAFRSRLLTFYLSDYSTAEVAQILKFKLMEGNYPPELSSLSDAHLRAISKMARNTPRSACNLMEQVGWGIALGETEIDPRAFQAALRAISNVDDFGLTPHDRLCMMALARYGRPLSLQNLADILELEVSMVSGIIEPFLMKNHWIRKTSRGRELTELGHKFVNEHLNTREI